MYCKFMITEFDENGGAWMFTGAEDYKHSQSEGVLVSVTRSRQTYGTSYFYLT